MFIVPFNVANVIEFLSSSFCRRCDGKLCRLGRSFRWGKVLHMSLCNDIIYTQFVITLCAAVRSICTIDSVKWKKKLFMIESRFFPLSIIIHFVASFWRAENGRWKKKRKGVHFVFVYNEASKMQHCAKVAGKAVICEWKEPQSVESHRAMSFFCHNHCECPAGEWKNVATNQKRNPYKCNFSFSMILRFPFSEHS